VNAQHGNSRRASSDAGQGDRADDRANSLRGHEPRHAGSTGVQRLDGHGGIRAMKGLAINATIPMPKIGYRQPFTDHARFAPSLVSNHMRMDVVGFAEARSARMRTSQRRRRTTRR